MSRFVLATTTNSQAEGFLNKGMSPQVVFASGVTTLDATSGSAGTDNTTALQAVLDTASASAPLILFIDGNTRTGKLRVKGNTSIIGVGSPKMWLKNGANSPFIQNYNPSANTITDEKIHLEGLDLECNRGNQTGIGTYGTQEANGNLMDGIQMFQVRNLTIRDCIVRHAQAIAIHYSGTNIVIDGPQIDNNDGIDQQGGIQCEGPSTAITISNVQGSAWDDLIAFAVDAHLWNQTVITGLGPYVGAGSITNVTVNNVIGYNCWSAVRFFGWDVSLINDIRVSNISGQFTGYPISFRNVGNVGKVSVDGVTVTHLASSNPYRSLVDLTDVTAKRITLTNIECDPVDSRPMVGVDNLSDIGTLELQVSLNETSSATAGMIPFIIAGTVKNLIVRDSVWSRDVSLTRAGAWMKFYAGATVTNLFLRGITANRCQYLVDQDTGSLTRMQAVGILHLDAGAGATLRAGNGTIDSVVMSNWTGPDQIYLDGGTVTATDGDAFDTVIPDPLNPDDETGLVAWSNPSTLGANGSSVSSWTDSSASSHPFVQATGSKQPTVVTAGLNGLSIVRLDGSNDFLSASPTSNAARTIFIVAKKRTAPSAGTIDLLNLGVTVNSQLYCNSAVSSTHAVYYDPTTGSGILSTGTVNAWTIYALVFNSASSLDIYANGTLALTGANPNDDYSANALMTLGGLNDGTLVGDWDIAEVFVYDVAKGSDIVAQLTLGLQIKYAL